MSKKEVLIDTSFLGKLSNNMKNIETVKKVLSDLEYSPVVHPYVADKELDMYPCFYKLVEEQFIRVAEYGEFLEDKVDKEIYEAYFMDIHNELREYLEAAGGKKKLDKLILPPGQTVFTYRKASMSLGDVHMILMAFFLKMPVILTEDADIELLRSITKRKMTSDSYHLDIYSAVDLLRMIAQKKDTLFDKKELLDILKRVGGKTQQSEIKELWNSSH